MPTETIGPIAAGLEEVVKNLCAATCYERENPPTPFAKQALDNALAAYDAKARQYDAAFAALESALRATLRFHHDRNHTETMTYQDCKMPPCEHATAALALAEGVRS